ncbi:Protein transport protein sec20 [Madurella mycetomatis]|uniref:Protein transport protein sec20 n=1 Tax=Madurella mycetomatis TaxID=100816 RepID=A0A175W2V8_9PEZI|nr:Protein transport protein sec20 [Madurella mycetomatis]
MSSLDTLQERLAALQETTGQLKDLIDRLANIKFQPGSVPLSTSDEDNVATELGVEISQILREEEEDLELLQEEIIDLRSGRPGSDAEHRKTRLKEGAQRLEAELKDCRTAFRRAQISARRSLEAARKLERSLLLASYAASANASPAASTILSNPSSSNGDNTTTSQQDLAPDATDPRDKLFPASARRRLNRNGHKDPNSSQNSDLITTSSDVTLALRRTHALIAGEVAKSAFASQTLAESSAALAELQRSYEGLDGLLNRSRDLVSALVTAQKSDTWYLQAALRLLLCTLAWLVFRRFLYGPLWWLVWLPLRTGFRVSKGVVSSRGSQLPHHQQQSSAGLGRMEVIGPGSDGPGRGTVVGVGEEGAVPTVKVGGEAEGKAEGEAEGDPDSMVEKVGKMVEDTLNQREAEADEANRTGGEGDEEESKPNPMKRMWEEEVGEPEPVRDEL